jgi:hypothetical protein
MPYAASEDPYLNDLARHANALIPALGGQCDEEDGAYLAVGHIRRFFFDPARTPEERAQVLAFVNHALARGGEHTETALVLDFFWDVCSKGEPFLSLCKEQLSPLAWTIFETHRKIGRRQGLF